MTCAKVPWVFLQNCLRGLFRGHLHSACGLSCSTHTLHQLREGLRRAGMCLWRLVLLWPWPCLWFLGTVWFQRQVQTAVLWAVSTVLRMCVRWTRCVSTIVCVKYWLVYTLLLRHNKGYFVKYQNILLVNPTNGLKYGERWLEDIWRWVCWSQVYGHNSGKTNNIEKSKKPAFPQVRTRESRIFAD